MNMYRIRTYWSVITLTWTCIELAHIGVITLTWTCIELKHKGGLYTYMRLYYIIRAYRTVKTQTTCIGSELFRQWRHSRYMHALMSYVTNHATAVTIQHKLHQSSGNKDHTNINPMTLMFRREKSYQQGMEWCLCVKGQWSVYAMLSYCVDGKR